MDPIIFVIVALIIGLGLGWFFGHKSGSGPVADWKARHAERDGEARALDEKFRRAIVELENATVRAERADALDRELRETRAGHERLLGETRAGHEQAMEELRGRHGQVSAELATLREKTANFDEQKRLLVEAREELLKEFQNTGSAVLTKAQEAFLERANERLGHSEKTSEAKLKALLDPVGERLAKYERQVAELEEKRTDAFGRLHQQIVEMQRGQEEVRREAQRLGNSLRNAPKARGRWGEQALKNVLEQCGLGEHTDFIAEHSIETDDGRLRPDAIVRIPGNKLLVIDAKVSLNDYQDAFEAESDEERERALDKHLASMKNHIKTLGAKSYQSQFDEAPDYVIMFVPGEHFVNAAIEHDAKRRTRLGEDALSNSDDLWNFAFKQRVLIATPTNLVAIARTVAQVWRQDTIANEAREIGKLGADLYSRLDTASQHLKRVGGGLETAVKNYNKFVGSFERNVMSAGRKLQEKGIEVGNRELEELSEIEASPRYNNDDLAEQPKLAAVQEQKSG